MKNIVTLDDVCKVKASKIIQKSLINLKGIYPVYGATGFIKNVDFYEQDEEYIAIVKDGAGIGKTMLLPKKSSILSTMQYILPKENIDIKYLYYAISYMDLRKYFTGATIPHIYFKDYKKRKLSLPNKQEQRNIVSKLISIDKLIELKKQQIIILNKLVSSLFIEMFGDPIKNPMNWNKKSLKELSDLILSGNTPAGGEKNYVNKGIMFLRSQNVWRNELNLDDVVYIDEETHLKMKKSSLKYKDILMTKTGRINTENSSLGRASLFLEKNDSANINGHVYLIRLKNGIVHEFVLEILISEAYRKYIRSICVGGIDKRQLNKEHIEQFPIILPPKNLVDNYVKQIKKFDKSKLAIQQSLEKLEILKKSLMQEYFG